MAEEIAKSRQYEYTANSNLVLQADRSELVRRDREVKSEIDSLYGRISAKDMGSRVTRSKPSEAKEDVETREIKPLPLAPGGTKKVMQSRFSSKMKVKTDDESFEGLIYVPKTTETRQVYDLILSFISNNYFNDYPIDVLRGAVDEILAILKNEELKDLDKKVQIERILPGSLVNEQFHQLVNLSKKLSDYHLNADESTEMDMDEQHGETKTNGAFKNLKEEEYGVTVVFGDEEDEDELHKLEGEDEEEEEEEDYYGEENEEHDDKKMKHEEGKTGFEKILPKYYINVREIDAFWLQRALSSYYKDAETSHALAQSVWNVMETMSSQRELENALVQLLEYDKFDLVKMLVLHRKKILFCMKLAKLSNDQKSREEFISNVKKEDPDLVEIIKILESPATAILHEENHLWQNSERLVATDIEMEKETLEDGLPLVQKVLDLESLAFNAKGHTMTNKRCKLPEASWKKSHPGYEEIGVPAPKPTPLSSDEKLIPIEQLPTWMRFAFPESMKALNRIQSRICQTALTSDQNLLICAPTGAGKTNVALLSILHTLGQHGLEDLSLKQKPSLDMIQQHLKKDAFKIVYIAPMKALVQEMVSGFSARLGPYGIKVAELTGDASLSKAQILETQMIVTTPEKWDVISRKTSDRSYTRLVRLIIIDEIHLLHDERGPVLEAIVARTLRQMEQYQDPVRIVGLSATLPNYADVATFLRVDLASGLFYFDGSYRPCPLQQFYYGFTEKKALKRMQLMNQVVYEKVIERAGSSQVLVFVHSRKDTAKTAKMIRDLAIEKGAIGQFLKEGGASREILTTEAATVTNADLQELLPYGFAIHHAGLNRPDRSLVEELFADGHLQVLVSTATLAWGVNLPAHTVIIKGTQVYSSERGGWTELSPQDILQMFGRAGRPQYDSFGEGLLLTSHTELQYYLSLMNMQLPIESQFVSKLTDHLNAEIVLGSIRNRKDAVEWLGYSYLYVRMLRDPTVYAVTNEEITEDPYLRLKRLELIHAAALALEKAGLVSYDKRTGSLISNENGRIAAHFYIHYGSMATYASHLKANLSEIDLFRLFSHSNEFKAIPIRDEEKLELTKLMESVPIPIKESVDDPSAKINVLLQAYIAGIKLEGFALMSDMVYVTQSAVRLLRALFEMALKKGFAGLAKKILELAKCVEQRAWPSQHPLRQLRSGYLTNSTLAGQITTTPIASILTTEVMKKLEGKSFPFEAYLSFTPSQLGELLGNAKLGRPIHRLLSHFPRLEVTANVQPISRSMLKLTLTITPDFIWETGISGSMEAWWIFVEDIDEERILLAEPFRLKEKAVRAITGHPDESIAEQQPKGGITVELFVPILDPLPPAYFVSIWSDKWLHSVTRLPISFKSLLLPEKTLPPTELLDLSLAPLTAQLLGFHPEAVKNKWPMLKTKLWNDIESLNPIQAQSFRAIYESDENILLAAASGNGKTLSAELAMLRHWKIGRQGKIVYVAPFESLVKEKAEKWTRAFEGLNPVTLFGAHHNNDPSSNVTVSILTGDAISDLKVFEKTDLVLATPETLENLTKRWRQRRALHSLGLIILDELHFISEPALGPIYEILVARLRTMTNELNNKDMNTRFIGLSVPVAAARDLGEWIGAALPLGIYNFGPRVRPTSVQVEVQTLNISHPPVFLQALHYPAYKAIVDAEKNHQKSKIVFVVGKKRAKELAHDFMTFSVADDHPTRFSPGSEAVDGLKRLWPDFIKRIGDRINPTLLGMYQSFLSAGIGCLWEGMTEIEMDFMLHVYELHLVSLLIVSKEAIWQLKNTRAALVFVLGTIFYDGRDGRYLQDSLSLLHHVLGRAKESVTIYTTSNRRDYYSKFIAEALPMDSTLTQGTTLHDAFITEIVSREITSRQEAVDWMTSTFLYRRLIVNPNYYHLAGRTHRHLSDGLSEMVENTLSDLQTSKMINMKDDETMMRTEDDQEEEIIPLSLAMIAAYYSVKYETIEMLNLSMKASTKLKGLLELLAAAVEFEFLTPVRKKEPLLLKKLYDRLPVKLSTPNPSFKDPHVKTHLLLQSTYERLDGMTLPQELVLDRQKILANVFPILYAMVDVASSNGWLTPALSAMDLCQMTAQALWERESPLKQLPGLDDESINTIQTLSEEIETLYDLIPEDADVHGPNYLPSWLHSQPLKNLFAESQRREIWRTLKRYPNIDVEFNLPEQEESDAHVYASNDVIKIDVLLKRPLMKEFMQVEAEDRAKGELKWKVHSLSTPYYPKAKEEGWWVLVAHPQTKALLSIKKLPLSGWVSKMETDNDVAETLVVMRVTLEFNLPEGIQHPEFKLYLMSDSWLGCDQEFDFTCRIAAEQPTEDTMETE